jgi:hypothetical protein
MGMVLLIALLLPKEGKRDLGPISIAAGWHVAEADIEPAGAKIKELGVDQGKNGIYERLDGVLGRRVRKLVFKVMGLEEKPRVAKIGECSGSTVVSGLAAAWYTDLVAANCKLSPERR